MARGRYAPLDRSRFNATHPVAAWGVDMAIDHAVAPAMPTVYKAARGVYAARRTYDALQAVESRPTPSLAHVGTELWHSVSDRERAIATIAMGFSEFGADVGAALAKDPSPANQAWFAADVKPTLDDWSAFAEREHASWWKRAATSWDAFTDWRTKLMHLRALARARGVTINSPEPPELPMTVWERGEKGEGGEVATWLGLLKIAVVAGIAVTGAVTLYSVIRDVGRSRPMVNNK